MAFFYKLYFVTLVCFLLHLSSSTIATRQPSYEYDVAKKEGEMNPSASANGGSVVCGSTTEGGTVQLSCIGAKISKITFASFGNPQGSCGSFSKGNCDAPDTLSVVQKACIGKESCTISATKGQFGPTSCKGTLELAVEATC